MSIENNGIFDEVRDYPDIDAKRRYTQLVGIDAVKQRLQKEAQILLRPASLEDWSVREHGKRISLVDALIDRPPLFLFGGDVGTGKTALAESFADPVARTIDVPITLYSLSLNSRGSGVVGEMTRLLSAAFSEIRTVARKSISKDGSPASAAVLLIDEADALAQSREFVQMHHEDRAGVNAVIRGIDNLSGSRLPVIVIMCTNRLQAIDPAIRRRAAATFEFGRPNEEQRMQVLRDGLSEIGFSQEEISEIAGATGPSQGRSYGYTYSDLTQRLLPTLVLDAFPDSRVTFAKAIEVVKSVSPTPPFASEAKL